jgi:hypothetical protein
MGDIEYNDERATAIMLELEAMVSKSRDGCWVSVIGPGVAITGRTRGTPLMRNWLLPKAEAAIWTSTVTASHWI